MTEHPPLTPAEDDSRLTLVVKIKPSSAERLDIISQEWGIDDKAVLAGLLLDELLSDTSSETSADNQAGGA
ncbi:hypothetical protein [Cyanobium sp. BA20m-p-22]|jgi:hypothetical protein|uniref:hypothetical protein n=1 Tax=Cyanobium sp. BA20m-p-22 TaxID=2823704 RepID=UPI0020CFE84F|nr:hypothetical protein [Cyanobium sp. BA20m-p-22]